MIFGLASFEECRYVAPPGDGAMERFYQRVTKERDDVEVINLDQAVCPFLPICDPVVGGLVVRWDHQHIAVAYSATLGDDLAVRLRSVGLLGG